VLKLHSEDPGTILKNTDYLWILNFSTKPELNYSPLPEL